MKYIPGAFFIAILFSIWGNKIYSKTNDFITTKGAEMVDAQGRSFIMKGVNIGNWLVPEGYMFHFKATNAPRQINEVIQELLGPEDAKAFWAKYLDNYITQEDIKYLKSTGMNSIRLPFHYKLFTTEDYLGTNDDTRGFKYIDSVVKWCRQEGLYVLLDMHCAPGGQTGDNIDDSHGYPFLYQSESLQLQTEQLWKKIALHYNNEPTVIGYDLLNEPIAHYFDASQLWRTEEHVFIHEVQGTSNFPGLADATTLRKLEDGRNSLSDHGDYLSAIW